MLALETSSDSLGTPAAPLDGLSILLVDDDPAPREIYSEVLTLAGAHVASAASAREALARMDAERFDLFISDIMMPGEDGYWLIRAVRQRSGERGGRVPALAITGDAETHCSERVVAAGFDGHMAKPMDIDLFCAAVAAMASGFPRHPDFYARSVDNNAPAR
jgi:CheY-like chemotaxis protein